MIYLSALGAYWNEYGILLQMRWREGKGKAWCQPIDLGAYSGVSHVCSLFRGPQAPL